MENNNNGLSFTRDSVPWDIRKNIIEHFLSDWREHGFGKFKEDEGRISSFRRIAAGLIAMKDQAAWSREVGGGTIYEPIPPANFPEKVEAWIKDQVSKGRHDIAGTDARGRGEGDYDMYLKEMISLLYTFREDKSLLTNEACFAMIDQGLGHYMGQEFKHKMVYKATGGIELPETENHVLMLLSSMYLTNQWILENPRNDYRLLRGNYRDRQSFKNKGGQLEDALLQATARIVHNDFFETNARPYQALSMHALLNLASFADAERVRIAAENALGFAFAKLLFQSIGALRLGPHRRNHKYVDLSEEYPTFETDSMIFVLGALTGKYAWDTSVWKELNHNNPVGLALWAVLLPYRMPKLIWYFSQVEKKGYWARFQSRFTPNHYVPRKHPRYFREDGSNFSQLPDGTSKAIDSAPEIYFVTDSFLNTAGGTFNEMRSDWEELVPGLRKNNVFPHDFLSRYTSLTPSTTISNWASLEDVGKEALFFKGHDRFWISDNSGVYKGFAYGYTRSPSEPPMIIPPRWEGNRDPRSGWVRNSGSNTKFAFFDLREKLSAFLITGWIKKSIDSSEYTEFSRGFWEVVPGHRFVDLRSLKQWVLEHNPDTFFDSRVSDYYRMTTGETLELNSLIGVNPESRVNPIKNIWPAGKDPFRDPPAELSEYIFDRSIDSRIANFPLMDVREVDENHVFTGRMFAYSTGNGLININNPFLGESLIIDSRDYRNPRQYKVSLNNISLKGTISFLDSGQDLLKLKEIANHLAPRERKVALKKALLRTRW